MPNQELLRQLVENPAESLEVELKSWIDPKSPEGVAKIVRACLAFWNNNGGFLLIGFDDDGEPSPLPSPDYDPRIVYHIDGIQQLVAKYSSYPFEICVTFVERGDVSHPVISVGNGVRTPVAAKADLVVNGRTLVKDNAIYVRTLKTNNCASTAEASRGDLTRLVDFCMNNREADIAGFIRRHLSDINLGKLAVILGQATRPVANMTQGIPEADDEPQMRFGIQPNFRDTGLGGALHRGSEAFGDLVKDRKLSLPDHGVFEAAIWVCGFPDKYSANQSFLNLVMASNPHYTGWPFWVDTRHFADVDSQPHVSGRGWQALIVRLLGDWYDKLDFWRIEPDGLFYHRRALEDDVNAPQHKRPALSLLDWGLVLSRVGEVIGTGLAFAREMHAATPLGSVGYAFKWSRLKGRQLESWSMTNRFLMPLGKAHDDAIETTIIIPPETAETAIFAHVHEATKPLFELFGGREIRKELVEQIVSPIFNRKS